jgi:hypothetical protein|nr:MAG TPA: hypothetical protein [Caudoviricetes sp.]
MNDFKIGDVVRVVKSPVGEFVGIVGIVIYSDFREYVRVRFLRDINGRGTYWFTTEQLMPIGRDDYVKYVEHDIEATNQLYRRYTKCQKNLDIRDAIKNVIYNDPATIVFWTDGTKTVVKAENEDFDPEKGLAMAISKKMLGNKGNYYEVFKKWLPREEHAEAWFLEDLRAVANRFTASEKLLQTMVSDAMNLATRTGKDIKTSAKEYKCSTCARFDDENMSCMISNCQNYSRYAKKDTHE